MYYKQTERFENMVYKNIFLYIIFKIGKHEVIVKILIKNHLIFQHYNILKVVS